MRIRLHKILAEGRSVRYERGAEEKDDLVLNIVVSEEDGKARGRTR
jgi:hypothetical protein